MRRVNGIFHSKKMIFPLFLLFVSLTLFLYPSNKIIVQQNKSTLQTIAEDTSYPGFKNYGNIPLYFEENNGQADENIKFLSQGLEYSLFLKQNETVLKFNGQKNIKSEFKDKSDLNDNKPESNYLQIKYLNTNKNSKISGLSQQRAKTNYFIGKNPSHWLTNISNYSKVKYENIYNGIDLVFYGNPGFLEFDYLVAPRANPEEIKFTLKGAENYNIENNGNLKIRFCYKYLTIEKPVIYQTTTKDTLFVDGSFEQTKENQIGFQVGPYDKNLALVIDPKIIYSTFIGVGEARAISVDNHGNAYISGRTDYNSFPITQGAFQTELKELRTYYSDYDVFITKLNAEGTGLVYSTYLGGGVGNEEVFDLAIDANGCAYVTGITYSHDFPTTPGAFKTVFNEPGNTNTFEMGECDAFVTKLDSLGSSLIYSTYLGGELKEFGFGIDVDKEGYAYVAGLTASRQFPTTPGVHKESSSSQYGGGAFVTKLSLDGTALEYSTYVGVSGDYATDIAVDTAGNAYITGHGKLTENYLDPNIFVAKLNNTGSALLFINQVGDGNSFGIDVDLEGNSYITGSASTAFGFQFPTTGGAFQSTIGDVAGKGYGDAFLTKLDPSGSTILYSTFIGGQYRDKGYDVTVDKDCFVYVAGFTSSDNLITKEAVQDTFGGNNPGITIGDGFVVKIDPTKSGDASLIFSTYLGGSSIDMYFDGIAMGDGAYEYPRLGEKEKGGGVAVDPDGNIYIFGTTGSSDFPLTEGAFDTTLYQYFDKVFVTKIGNEVHNVKLIYDQVVNSGPPVFSRTPTTPQQTLPQYFLNSKEDTITFRFEGKSTDGKVALRISNTKIATVLPLDLSESVTIRDPNGDTILGSTLFNIGSRNFGKQFDVTKNGTYIIKVAAGSSSTFPSPFQIHLAGNVGLPTPKDFPRSTRLDILFNHTAPRPQGIYGKADGAAQTALFKFGNPSELSPFAVAVMAPQLSSGFPLNTAILRAPDPMQPLNITTPTARTPLCAGGDPTGFVIDFTQVPDPAVIPANLDGSICAVIGKNDGTKYTTTSSLIFDMGSGQEIVNGEENDFEVFSSAGNYTVAVSNTPYAGTFIPIGAVISGTQKFDLSNTGLTSARFVLITASGSVTLDAIKALNVFIDGVVTDPSSGSQILVGDVGYATMTMRRAKAPQLEFDPFLELIAPDGSRFGENESGFADKTSQDLSDAALINIDLVQSGFYRFLGRGYHQNPGNQSSGAFFVRLESGGKYDPQDIVVSDKDEKNTQPQKSGTINQTRQRDSYLFQWHPGQSINIVVNAKDSKLDPVLELYDPEDFLIAANDNFDTRDKNAVLQVNLPANSFNGNETLPDPSTYRIVVSAVDSAGKATPKGEFTVFQRTVSGGNYDLKVFTGSLAPPEPKAPNITNILPNGLIQGANDVELLINGNNFLDGATVSFNQPGIIVRSVTFINSNKLKVKVNILSSTPIGWYNLTVTNPGNLGRTVPQILEIRSNFGTVNLSWDAPTSGENMAPPANLSSQVSGQSSLSKKTRHPQKQVKSLSKNNSNMTTKINRSQVKILASFDIIDEIEPNNNFSTAQVLTGDSMIFVDGWAEITDNGDFIFNYNEGDDDIEDWYKIRTKSPGLDIDLYNFSSDCDLYLFNQPDTSGLVDLSNTIGDTVEEWIYDSELPAGTYFIGVSIFDPAPGGPDTTYYALDIYGDFESGSSSDVVSYNIYRSTHPNARQTGTLIANVDASATTFQDTPPSKQLQYYQVTAVYDQGESDPSNETSVLITKVEEETILPESLTLYQNYPNPFNPSTTIKYSIPQQLNQSNVKLSIFDLSGRKIKTLINQKQNVGTHKISWNGIDDFGNKVTSGMYLYRLQIGTFSEIRKMLLMK